MCPATWVNTEHASSFFQAASETSGNSLGPGCLRENQVRRRQKKRKKEEACYLDHCGSGRGNHASSLNTIFWKCSEGPVCVLAWPACRKRVETSWKQSVAGADSLYCPHGMPARPVRKQLETWGPAHGTRGGNIWKQGGNKGPSCGFPVLATQNWVGPLCTDSGNKWKQVWKQAPVCRSTTLAE